MTVKQIKASELQKIIQLEESSPVLLDVREPFEYQIANIDNSVLIPLGQIQQRMNELDSKKEIIVICHHGMRSQQVADYLVNCGFTNVSNLDGGIDSWSIQCDPEVPRY